MPTVESHPFVSLVAPRAAPIALVCDSPHSGTFYPDDFGHSVAFSDLRKCEDTLVEALWSQVPDVGGTLIHARFPRSYIDVNRSDTDLEVDMLCEPWPADVQPSERCLTLGNGLVFSKTTTLARIYDRKLSVREVQQRIDRCWVPYRAALRNTLRATRTVFGRVWHLNLHSMPSNAYERLGRKSATPLADVVLGDLHGRSCSSAFAQCVSEAFRALGYRVALNDPYAGQDIVREHGQPDAGCESLQIEINRRLYLNEETRLPNAGYVRLHDDIGRVLRSVADHILAETGRQPSLHSTETTS